MSVPQLGYNNASPTSLSPSLLMTSSTAPTIPSIPTSCCENGRPIMTDPHTGQSVCSCQYGSSLLSAYSRVPGLGDSMYTSPHYATQGYMPLNSDTSAFYSPLNAAHYDTLKDTPAAEAWRGITQPTACYPYDPTMAAYPYANTYGGMDLNGAARRKNATRETTNTLKAWLYEHRKNPYPTKGEKIMLAIITKMTLTQVSTWFANARRRLKKENKMTWSPRNRCADDDDDVDKNDDMDDDDDNEGKDKQEKNNNEGIDNKEKDISVGDSTFTPLKDLKNPFSTPNDDRLCLDKLGDTGLALTAPDLKPQASLVPELGLQADLKRLGSPCSNSSDSGLSDINSSLSANGSGSDQTDALRPRIWSLAHVATSTAMSSPSATMPDSKTQATPLNPVKPGNMIGPSFVTSSSSSTMRPWLDSTFNVGSSLFSPLPGTYSTLGAPRPKEVSNTVNQSLSSLNGLSSPSLSRPYPSLTSLYGPVRDLSKRNLDTTKIQDLCS